MAFAIKALGYLSRKPCPVAGMYLKALGANPEQHQFTRNIFDALHYRTIAHTAPDRVRLTNFDVEFARVPGTRDFLNPGEPGYADNFVI